MTISMPDSIYPGNIPMGYPAVLGYVDGNWPTADRLPVLFPAARRVTLTVRGGGAFADGCDCETGDLSLAGAAAWLHLRIQAGQWRPVLYASRDNVPGVLGVLAGIGVARQQVRILTAHYGSGQHICSPATCKATFTADGTQWTDTFPGIGGALIDMSLLADDFFGAPAPPTTVKTPPATVNWTETTVQQLPTLQQGATGAAVSRVQGLLVAAGYDLGTTGLRKDGIDGTYGAVTATAVRALQAAAHITVDGVVGTEQTWPALLGV